MMLKELRTVFLIQTTLVAVTAIFLLERWELNTDLENAEVYLISMTLLIASEDIEVLPSDFQSHEGGESFEDDLANNYSRANNNPEVLRLINFTRNSFWSIAQSAPMSPGRRLYFANIRPGDLQNDVDELIELYSCGAENSDAEMILVRVFPDTIVGEPRELLFSDREPVWVPELLGFCWGPEPELTLFLPDARGGHDAYSDPSLFEEQIQTIGTRHGLQNMTGEQIYASLRTTVESAQIRVPILDVSMNYQYALSVLLAFMIWGKISAISLLIDITKARKENVSIEGRFFHYSFGGKKVRTK